MHVYKAIAAVTADIAREGITKSRRNQQQGYNFRGIDDVYNALSPILSKHGLCILPRVLSRESMERTTAKGGVLFYTTVEVEFDFVAAEDGSKHTIKTYGEAMDSADKSTNKAMSAAYKYAAMQAFCIPTEGDNDADAVTHKITPKGKPQRAHADDNPFSEPDRAAFADDADDAVRLISEAATLEALGELWRTQWIQSVVTQAPAPLSAKLIKAKDDRKAALSARAAA